MLGKTPTFQKHRLLLAGTVLALAGLSQPGPARAGPARGTLVLRVSGFEHDGGRVIAKLFRRGDGAPKGPGYRKLTQGIQKHRATLAFRDVPHGTYAVFVFHDKNNNGTVDHNFLGLPTEPLGFSGGFKVSLFSGVPDFDDLKFEFTAKAKPVAIVVE